MPEHIIGNYAEVELFANDPIIGAVSQIRPFFPGDCNVIKIKLMDEPPEGAILVAHIIDPTSSEVCGDFTGEIIDGMEITVIDNPKLFNKSGTIKVYFSIEINQCRKSVIRPAEINTYRAKL